MLRWHNLYNAFFSAFHSKKINIMIYFYFHVFETTTAIHCPMKISFPPLQHAAALVGCFPRINRQFTIENFRMKKVNNSKNNLYLLLLALYFRPNQSLL